MSAFWSWIWRQFEFFSIEWTTGFVKKRFYLSTSPGGMTVMALIAFALVVVL